MNNKTIISTGCDDCKLKVISNKFGDYCGITFSQINSFASSKALIDCPLIKGQITIKIKAK